MFIGLEHAPPSFDVKGKLLGPAVSVSSKSYFDTLYTMRQLP